MRPNFKTSGVLVKQCCRLSSCPTFKNHFTHNIKPGNYRQNLTKKKAADSSTAKPEIQQDSIYDRISLVRLCIYPVIQLTNKMAHSEESIFGMANKYLKPDTSYHLLSTHVGFCVPPFTGRKKNSNEKTKSKTPLC